MIIELVLAALASNPGETVPGLAIKAAAIQWTSS